MLYNMLYKQSYIPKWQCYIPMLYNMLYSKGAIYHVIYHYYIACYVTLVYNMLYSNGGIYHPIYQWYIAMCTVVYTLLYNIALLLCYKLFNTAPLLCYKLFNTAHCYVTSYLTLLFNMLNNTFRPAHALQACLPTPALPWMHHFCSAVFIHRQTRPWPLPHHHQHPLHHPPPRSPPRSRRCRPPQTRREETFCTRP